MSEKGNSKLERAKVAIDKIAQEGPTDGWWETAPEWKKKREREKIGRKVRKAVLPILGEMAEEILEEGT